MGQNTEDFIKNFKKIEPTIDLVLFQLYERGRTDQYFEFKTDFDSLTKAKQDLFDLFRHL